LSDSGRIHSSIVFGRYFSTHKKWSLLIINFHCKKLSRVALGASLLGTRLLKVLPLYAFQQLA
jgi:hypothetical protein